MYSLKELVDTMSHIKRLTLCMGGKNDWSYAWVEVWHGFRVTRKLSCYSPSHYHYCPMKNPFTAIDHHSHHIATHNLSHSLETVWNQLCTYSYTIAHCTYVHCTESAAYIYTLPCYTNARTMFSYIGILCSGTKMFQLAMPQTMGVFNEPSGIAVQHTQQCFPTKLVLSNTCTRMQRTRIINVVLTSDFSASLSSSLLTSRRSMESRCSFPSPSPSWQYTFTCHQPMYTRKTDSNPLVPSLLHSQTAHVHNL